MNQVQTVLTLLPQTILAQRLLPNHMQSQLPQLQAHTHDLNQVGQTLLNGDHIFLILLQNSQELRATGGFMGSYIRLHLHDGQIADMTLHDIYEPDGQFTGLVAAPSGVQEYLSSGHGLRLPDANWSPDFPTSAQQILSYFAYGKETQIDGLVAVNLKVAEDLLRVTGDIYLPDYHVTVTPDNLADIARSDRNQFFPGSYQKPQFLQALVTQLKLKLGQLTPTQQKAVIEILLSAGQTKDIQLYSPMDQIEQTWTSLNIGGALALPTPNGTLPFYFLPIESNVGINKANRFIQRQAELNLGDYRSTATLTWTHTGTTSAQLTDPQNQNYVNYQRFWLNPEVTVSHVTINDQPLDHWDESLITTSSHATFKQIGFLVTVLAGQKTTIALELTHPSLFVTHQQLTLMLPKQSGVPPTPYVLHWADQTKNLLLEKNELLTLPMLE